MMMITMVMTGDDRERKLEIEIWSLSLRGVIGHRGNIW